MEQGDWEAEYEFFNKIITDEVARLRWNQGFEPLDCQLYPLSDERGRIRKYVGETRICHRDFEVTAWPGFDGAGAPILKLQIRVAARKNH